MTIEKEALESLENKLVGKEIDYLTNNTIHFTDSTSLTFNGSLFSFFTYNDPEL